MDWGRLAPELLELIVEPLVQERSSLPPYRQRDFRSLLEVCKHWNSTLTECSKFWSFLLITSGDDLPIAWLALQRSKGR
ncbi:hypothetical protein SISSUDRAFT_1048789 [Sistotremastrum suecicum HHB10207 ss-3]|uniref:F-box domain-containing protein n=1 Tax=Sistotremastrum suecicum HHB10207 ss-3 TaxID=1314776 RepID=A0A166CA14_9AGAM|nr:hypothetical protein SISSUDRAFT_1048789 [Sistotremastrum suecicum HHB10207 ss-3]